MLEEEEYSIPSSQPKPPGTSIPSPKSEALAPGVLSTGTSECKISLVQGEYSDPSIDELLKFTNREENFSIIRSSDELILDDKMEVLSSEYVSTGSFNQEILLYINGQRHLFDDEFNGKNFYIKVQAHRGLYKLANAIDKLRVKARKNKKTVFVSLSKHGRKPPADQICAYKFHVEDIPGDQIVPQCRAQPLTRSTTIRNIPKALEF